MVPVIHGVYRYGWQVQKQRMGVVWVLLTLALNVTGATAYAVKVSLVTHFEMRPSSGDLIRGSVLKDGARGDLT